MTDLNGKTAAITGSARGPGKVVGLRYAPFGANVVDYASSLEAAAATVTGVSTEAAESPVGR